MIEKISYQRINSLLSKPDWNEIDYLQFILEASASSARFGKIVLHEENTDMSVRGNLHTMLILPFGSGKTTGIADIENSIQIKDMTYPAVVGTINRNGELVKSYLMEAAGKVLVFDEFHRVDLKTKEAFNDILEEPRRVQRSIGFKVNAPYRKKGKFFSVNVRNNYIDIYSRFSCITCGLAPNIKVRDKRERDVENAFFSRFLPFSMKPTIEYYENLTRGRKMIKINPILRDFSFEMPKEEYLKFHSFFWNELKGYPFMEMFDKTNKLGYMSRFLGDAVRVGAFIASLEDRNIITFEDCKLVFDKLCKFSIPSYITFELNEKDYQVFSNFGLKREEIAEKIGISISAVDKSISRLRSFGLLKD